MGYFILVSLVPIREYSRTVDFDKLRKEIRRFTVEFLFFETPKLGLILIQITEYSNERCSKKFFWYSIIFAIVLTREKCFPGITSVFETLLIITSLCLTVVQRPFHFCRSDPSIPIDILIIYLFIWIGTSGTAQNPPLSPSELLVALHTIESKSDVKAIMKGRKLKKNINHFNTHSFPLHANVFNYVHYLQLIFHSTEQRNLRTFWASTLKIKSWE